jgi:signal transduction histidine kinase
VSLRTRLVLSFGLVVVVCLGIIAVAVSLIIQNYRDRFTLNYLEDTIRPVFVQVRTIVNNNLTLDTLGAGLQEQAADSKLYILLTDVRGKVVWQAAPDGSVVPNSLAPAPELLPTLENRNVSGRFDTPSGETFLYVGQFLGRQISLGGRITFTSVVLAVPRGQPVAILVGLVRPFLFAGLAAFAVALVIALFLARSLYRPVQRVTDAAGDIARGQYGQEIAVAGPAEVKKLAASFNTMSREVKLAQDRLRHFVADVSHQLKSPLTSIRGFAQAITDGTAADDETRERSAHVIEEESGKMMRQVDELLELSRMQSGAAQMAAEPVDLEALLKQVREIYSLRIEEKKLNLVMDVGLLPVITGDADRLEQVFSNLVDNAIKNSLEGGEIRVTARKREGTVDISVEDHGAGIPPEQLPYVFERFYQAIGVRTGVGLGLAIARQIILGHGGDIIVTSSPGEKTEFRVTLPVPAAGEA